MIWSRIGKKRSFDEKNAVLQVEYWLENNQVVKVIGKERHSVEFLFSYYNFYKKTKYILWLERDDLDSEGTRVLHLGSIETYDECKDKMAIIPVADEYQMINAIIGLKKSIAL